MNGETLDLLVIGGGINGAGIARDAAGRGLKVALVEQDDLASATSSWSSKLIHGGLRYLEQYEFRLVRESLREREVLLRLAPHIIRPLLFVLPHDASMRPALDDPRRASSSTTTSAGASRCRAPRRSPSRTWNTARASRATSATGFVYSDCRVDDARLTVINAMSAREKGAAIHVRTRFERAHARRRRLGSRGERRARQASACCARGRSSTPPVPGSWTCSTASRATRIKGRVRLVKGSHIIVPKVHSQGHAWILQNPDKRVVFVIPYQDKFSLIGTTDVPVADIESAPRDQLRGDRLPARGRQPLPRRSRSRAPTWSRATPACARSTTTATADPSQVTRDYVLKVDHAGRKRAAAHRLRRQDHDLPPPRRGGDGRSSQPFFPGLKGATGPRPRRCPAATCRTSTRFRDEMSDALPRARAATCVDGVVAPPRHRAPPRCWATRARLKDLGRYFGAGLTRARDRVPARRTSGR